jgi:hypothetical protein
MGDTLRLAERTRLVEMEPRGDLSSTGYALANPGQEYIVLQPEPEGSFTVALETGTYSVEWFGVDHRETVEAGTLTIERSSTVTFSPPSEQAGPAVLTLTTLAG